MPRRAANTRSDYRYRTIEWEVTRQHVLMRQKCCAMCQGDAGVLTDATVADHIVPVRWNIFHFHDRDHIWGLCRKCDNRKQQLEGQMTALQNVSKEEALQHFMRSSIAVSRTLYDRLALILKELTHA